MGPARCCGLCRVGSCLQSLTVLVVIFDLLLCCGTTYVVICFRIATKDTDFTEDFKSRTTFEQRSNVENNYVRLMIPVIVVLYYKTYKGLLWIRRRFTRAAMQTYYMMSIAFYASYFAQGTFLMLFTWNVYRWNFKSLLMFNLCVIPPLWIIVVLNMRFLDRQAFALNTIRRVHKTIKRRRIREAQMQHEQIKEQ